MKRWATRFAAAALALLGHGAPAPLFAQELPPVVPQQVAPFTWYVQGQSALGGAQNGNFISNAGFVVTSAGVVVVDALGSPALAAALLAQIRRITPLPVTHVIVTHYHADHIYGLQTFKAAGAQVIAHQAGRDYLNSDTARLRMEASRKDLAPWIDTTTQLVPADRWIDGDTEIEVGGQKFMIRAVGPAHTPEDLAVYVPGHKVLFAGDLVFRGRIPYVGQADSRHWIAALEGLLSLDADVVVPGHGPASTSGRADMQLTRDYLVYLRATMRDAARNLEPFDAAYQAADWSRFSHMPLFAAANRMNAYNTYLLMEQERD